MKQFLTAILLCSAIACHAQILVYKLSESGHSIGNGADYKQSRAGSFVLDAATGRAYALSAYSSDGTKFIQTDALALVASHPSGKLGQSWTMLKQIASTGNSDFMVITYGQDAVLKITSGGQTVDAPKTFTGKVLQVVTSSGTDSVVWDASYTLTFDQKSTLIANAGNQAAALVAAQVVATYTAKGFTATGSSL